MKANTSSWKVFLAILLLTACKVELCSAMGFFQSGYRMRSYKGIVIDRDTKKPIEGVVVAGIYQTAYLSPGGSGTFDIDAQEGLTDKNGEFVIPERFVKSKKYQGKKSADLVAFKPGYKMAHIDNYHLWKESKSFPDDVDAVFKLIKLSGEDDLNRNEDFSISDMKHRLYVLSQYLDQQNIEAGTKPYNLWSYWRHKGIIGPEDKTILDSKFGLFRGTLTTTRGRSSARIQYPEVTTNIRSSSNMFISSASVSTTRIYSIRYENDLEQKEFIEKLSNGNNIFSVTNDDTVEFFEENKGDIFRIKAKIDKKPRIFFFNKEYAELFMTLLRESGIPFFYRTKPDMIGYDIVWNYNDISKAEKAKLKFFNYVIKVDQQQENK